MKFRGFRKNGYKAQLHNDISDPGSEDSWDLLYKTEDSRSNVPAKPQLVQATSPQAAASSASTAPRVPQEQKDKSKENAVGHDPSLPQTIIANTSAELKENIASDPGKEKLLLITSTPFLNHKKAPIFDVSSFIAPIDVSSIEGLPKEDLPNDSETTLMVKRNNVGRAGDDTFSQLLNPRKKSSKPASGVLPGIKPLKTVVNQADTTRQYAGGAVRKRGFSAVNDVESSWETTEATTCTGDLQKLSSSPCKATRRSKGSSEPSGKTDEGKGESAIKANFQSESETGLQHVNKLRCTAVVAKPTFKGTSRGEMMACQDGSSDPRRTEKKQASTVIEDCGPWRGVEANSSPEKRRASRSESKTSKHQVQRGSNTSTGNTNANDTEEFPNRIVEPQNKAVEQQNNPDQESSFKELIAGGEERATQVISKLPENGMKADKSMRFASDVSAEPAVQSTVLSNNAKCSNVSKGAEEKNDKPSALSKSNLVNEQETEKLKNKTLKHQINKMSIIRAQVEESGSEKTFGKQKMNHEPPVKVVDGLNLQEQVEAADHNIESVDNQLAECHPRQQTLEDEHMNPRQTGNAVKMVCHQSEFLIKIGSCTLKQSSCFGFALTGQMHAKTDQSSLATQSQNMGLKLNAAESTHDKLRGTSNTVGCALKESNPTVSQSRDFVTPINQQVNSNDVESSSEEERILLRAQSLRMKENKSYSSRNSKSNKILDNGHLGLNTQSSSRGDKSNGVAQVTKSPTKSFVARNLQEANEQIKETESAVVSSQCIEKDLCQPPQPQTCVSDSNASSCDLVLVSRNPTDFQQLCCGDSDDDNENLQLEILSSSEEEGYVSTKQKKQSQNGKKTKIAKDLLKEINLVDSKHSNKGRNLSFKAKEMRRRREQKIKEKLEFQRHSSDSDSQPPRSPSKRRGSRHGIAFGVSKAGEDPMKTLKKQKKKENFIANHGTLSKSLNGVSAPSEHQEIVEQYSHGSFSEHQETVKDPVVADKNVDLNSRDKRSKKELTSKQSVNNPEISSKHAQGTKKPQKQKDHDSKVRKQFLKQRDIESEGYAVPVPIIAEEIMSAEPDMPEDVIQPKDTDNEGPASQKERNIKHINKTEASLGRKNPLSTVEESDREGNLRRTSRNRKPPSMYWLGRRTPTYDRPQEGLNESSSGHDELINQPKRQKRKIEKASRSGAVKTLKRVKQTESKPTVSHDDNSQPHTGNEELVYDAFGTMKHEGQHFTCEMHEVKFTELVSGHGVKGNMLSLGVGAKYDELKPSAFNQVFYILKGEINYHFAQEEKTLKTGSVIIVPKGKQYQIKNSSKSTAMLFVTGGVV